MKVFTGQVVSTKMEKTATVAVERVYVHSVYKKRIKRVKRYHVHDALGVEVGQIVNFVASKPYSKTKKWRIIATVDDKKGGKHTKKASAKKKEVKRKK